MRQKLKFNHIHLPVLMVVCVCVSCLPGCMGFDHNMCHSMAMAEEALRLETQRGGESVATENPL